MNKTIGRRYDIQMPLATANTSLVYDKLLNEYFCVGSAPLGYYGDSMTCVSLFRGAQPYTVVSVLYQSHDRSLNLPGIHKAVRRVAGDVYSIQREIIGADDLSEEGKRLGLGWVEVGKIGRLVTLKELVTIAVPEALKNPREGNDKIFNLSFDGVPEELLLPDMETIDKNRWLFDYSFLKEPKIIDMDGMFYEIEDGKLILK